MQTKLERIVGGCADTMQLTLYTGSRLINSLDVDEALISNYNFDRNMCLHIDDSPDAFFKKKMEVLKVGDRCIVSTNGIEYFATARYIGGSHQKAGLYVGVEFEEQVGDNDGRWVRSNTV